MTITTQDGRALEITKEFVVFTSSDGEAPTEVWATTPMGYECGSSYRNPEGNLGSYGHWFIAEWIANEIVDSLDADAEKYEMPPYMNTTDEWHTWRKARMNANLLKTQTKELLRATA